MATMISVAEIRSKVLLIRKHFVLLDSDLAEVFCTETRFLNRAAARNEARFPDNFRFQLTQAECASLRTNGHGGRRTRPYAYTQEGVAMLSCVLNSDIAIQANVSITKAYVEVRSSFDIVGPLKDWLEHMDSKLNELLSLQKQPPRELPQQPPVLVSLTIDPHMETLEKTLALVAKAFKTSPQALKRNTRRKEVVLPRQVAIYLIRRHQGVPLKEIARHFGLSDHTTISHAIKKIETLIDNQTPIARVVQTIEDTLRLTQRPQTPQHDGQ